MFPPPPARSQYSVLIRARAGARARIGGRGRVRVRTRLRAGVGVRVRVGYKDSVGVQNGQNCPSGAFGALGASGVFGAHGLLRLPFGGGGGGGVLCPAESPPPPRGFRTVPPLEILEQDGVRGTGPQRWGDGNERRIKHLQRRKLQRCFMGQRSGGSRHISCRTGWVIAWCSMVLKWRTRERHAVAIRGHWSPRHTAHLFVVGH